MGKACVPSDTTHLLPPPSIYSLLPLQKRKLQKGEQTSWSERANGLPELTPPEHQTQPGQPCQTGLGQQHPPSSQDNQCKMGQDRLFFMTDSSFLLLSSASNSFSQSYSRLAQKSPSLFPPKSPEKDYAGAIYPDFTEINRALTNFFPSQVLQPLGKETQRILGQPERRIQIFVSALGPSLLRGKVEPRRQEQKCSAFLTGMDVIIMPPSSATAMDLSPW